MGYQYLQSHYYQRNFLLVQCLYFVARVATRIKILWWDGQGFCMFYKYLNSGKFPWLNMEDKASVGITRAQLSMLLEGVDWRNPKWTEAPKYAG